MARQLTKILSLIILIIIAANITFAQGQKPPYQIIVDSEGDAYFNGKGYTSITIFLNNNTNDTLYYSGVDCWNSLFRLKSTPYFHLSNTTCNNYEYRKMALPPHRSQKMQVYLTEDRDPDKIITLSFAMKLYRWSGNKYKQPAKYMLFGQLSDNIILYYNTNHQLYWPVDSLGKKQKSILPNKDIYLLTNNDRKIYALTVEKSKITKPTIIYKIISRGKKPQKMHAITVPVILHNNSKDTLKFYSMSCSWFEFWETNNQDINLADWSCDSNYPVTITVAPYQQYKKKLDIIYDANLKPGSRYRISMNLLKVFKSDDRDFDFLPHQYLRFNNIWSDEIAIQ